jgi:hypothetical protein
MLQARTACQGCRQQQGLRSPLASLIQISSLPVQCNALPRPKHLESKEATKHVTADPVSSGLESQPKVASFQVWQFTQQCTLVTLLLDSSLSLLCLHAEAGHLLQMPWQVPARVQALQRHRDPWAGWLQQKDHTAQGNHRWATSLLGHQLPRGHEGGSS